MTMKAPGGWDVQRYNIYNELWSKMTVNYWVVVERYPFFSGVVGGSISALKSSLDLMGNLLS
jgi:hypothetical protein